MHLMGHAASALPFLAAGWPWAAAAAIAPDLTWVVNEIRYRRWANEERRRGNSGRWEEWIDGIEEKQLVPYRIAHSTLLLCVACAVAVASGAQEWVVGQVAVGWGVHLLLDLPTHRGRMQQCPFYPFMWRWPWLIT